jgi:predicted amidohydrolase
MSATNKAPLHMRVGCVQWHMRPFASIADFLTLVEQQIKALAAYQCDFALFPEFFTTPLLALTPTLDSMAGMRELATHSEGLVAAIAAMAARHRINVITGSMPMLEGKRLFNVACLCHRNGKVEQQAKLHPTPGEKSEWNMQGGNSLRAFDTDSGRIGILICYDVEFPELARLQAEQGIDVLFVPLWTDSKHGYLRVRLCAQARAIENEIYVVLAGSVGSLPQVGCLDNQYGQSAIFSPSDFGFAPEAIVAEATANIETLLVADLDLDKLARVRRAGTVRNGADRRRDLYTVQWLGKVTKTGKQGKAPTARIRRR